MSLRYALDDYVRSGEEAGRFPGERRTVAGRFSGVDDRLVHVAPDGAVRDFTYPLAGLSGVARSRFGVAFETDTAPDGVQPAGDASVHWFDDGDQSYADDSTTVVDTVHEVAGRSVRQRDYTDGRVHHTRFETDEPALIYAYVAFTPDRTECQRAVLNHGDAVEVYHRREHDYLAVGSGDLAAVGEIPETLGELLSDEPTDHPTERPAGRYEDRSLTGGVVCATPTDDGVVSLATLLTDGEETDRTAAVERTRAAAREGVDAVPTTPESTPELGVADPDLARILAQDRRVLRLLTAPGGGRIAAPDFDPLYVSSGGYGYTWFRDDAEIARFLVETDDRLSVSLSAFHDRAVAFYADTQRPDGAWPHRVWPADGALAPGWATARLEAGDDGDYQADQTASVVSFLATYLRTGEPAEPERLRDTLVAAVDALDDTLAADGLPADCQNAWENMQGRFSHTAFTFLEAYAALARVADDPGLTERAPELAARAETGISRLLDGIERLWLPAERRYGLRVEPGAPAEESVAVDDRDPNVDPRADAASLAAAGALSAVDAVRSPSAARIDRLVAHVDNTVAELYRETDAVRGLVRFDGDQWRRDGQPAAKVWTVSTAWGAHASATLAGLLTARDDDRAAAHDTQARSLLAELLPGGSLLDDGGYLPEQFFDDGTADSGRPLGWPHALRTATATALADRDALRGPGELVGRR